MTVFSFSFMSCISVDCFLCPIILSLFPAVRCGFLIFLCTPLLSCSPPISLLTSLFFFCCLSACIVTFSLRSKATLVIWYAVNVASSQLRLQTLFRHTRLLRNRYTVCWMNDVFESSTDCACVCVWTHANVCKTLQANLYSSSNSCSRMNNFSVCLLSFSPLSLSILHFSLFSSPRCTSSLYLLRLFPSPLPYVAASNPTDALLLSPLWLLSDLPFFVEKEFTNSSCPLACFTWSCCTYVHYHVIKLNT